MVWVCALTPSLAGGVTLGKWLDLFKPQLPHTQNQATTSPYFMSVVRWKWGHACQIPSKYLGGRHLNRLALVNITSVLVIIVVISRSDVSMAQRCPKCLVGAPHCSPRGSHGQGPWAKSYLFIYLFIYWLHWVFVAVRGLSLVAVSGGYSLLRCAGFSLRWLLLLRSTGSRHAGSVAVARGL